MVDGPTEAADLALTETNRQVVRAFVDGVLVHHQLEKLERFIDEGRFTQHNPHMADGISALRAALDGRCVTGFIPTYDRIHRVLAEGNFVLAVSEGSLNGAHSSFYDLFRVDSGKLVEHWDTIETIPPRSKWKNENGKF